MKKFSFMLALFLFCGLGYAKKTGAPPATKALTSNGVVAYGNILGPAAEVGYVQFDVDRIKSKSLVSSSMPTGLYGGGYHDGKLYAYQVNETTEGVPQDVTFYVFNATTGAVISQTPRSELYGKIVDAVAYDYSGNTMYAVEGNKLYTMDLSVGTLTKVDSIIGVAGKLAAIAIDLSGMIYGVNIPASGVAKFYKIDKTTTVATEVGSTGRFNVQNPQSMGFDYDNGTLYWCEATKTSANFLKVDPTTAKSTVITSSTYVTTCFFIPYKVGQPTGVTDLTLTPGASGALSATLSWTNPSKTIAGEALEELTTVKIYEDDNTTPVQTISTLTIGGTSQCTVTVTDAKNYKYTVVAENSFGETRRTVSGWIGPDVPAAPKNVVLTANGMIGTLNWTAPTIGLNGGWFDASTLTYTIVRLAKDTVAKGITATTYTDNTATIDSIYTYKVIAVNGKGTGGLATSNQSVLGASKTVPYTMGFETGEAYNRWAIEDANENVSVVTWTRYTYASAAHTGSASMRYAGQGLKYAGNDWLFSPKITLETGKNYRIKFWTRSFSTIYAENIACYIASGQHSSLVIGEPVWRKENLIQNTHFEVDIPLQDYAGGDYSFAIHAYSDSLMSGLYVDDFSITELSGEDVVAVKLFGNDSVMAGKSFIYKAMVKNNGASTLTDYTVKLVDASNQVLATGTSLPNIASCESALINFSWTPTTAGDFTLRAIVETSGDADASNDTTNQILVKVTPANDLYEVSIGTKGTGVAPNNGQYLVPFNFYYKSGKAQTLYFDHELIGQSGVITEIQYFNRFTTSDNAIDKPVQIWMANTTLDKVDTAWLPDSEFTLVYDGTKTFPKGNNTISFTLDYPFEYTGKNLAIMTIRPENIMHAANDVFFVSQDFDFSGRTRYYWPNDYEEFDVTHPGIMHPLHYYPNMVVKMGFEGGSVSGTVTDGENPLAGATVQVVGTTMKRTTDENGQYNFEFLLPGDYQFKMTKHGYNDSISPLATITVDNNSTVDFSTRPTDVYTVSGRVSSSSAPYPAGMEGVQITLSGYEDYTTSTDASGNYAISGIYSGYTYDVHIKHPGYVVYDSAVTVQDKDTTFLISLREYTPVVLNAVAKKEANNAVITWTKPQISSFRYDNGMMTGQIGFSSGSSNLSVFGSAHRTGAILDKMSWYITNETQHTHVDLFVFGLDSNGIPSVLDSIYFIKNIPNTNGQWCEYEFPEPLEVPNGFFIGMSASDGGFLSLGMDSTTDESPFRYATHYVTPKYTDFFFSPLESVAANMLKNPMIRAEGLSLGDISFDAMQKAVQTSSERKNLANYTPTFIPSAPVKTESDFKATTTIIPANYAVYRMTEGQAETDWEQLATPTDTSYTDTDFSTLTAGVYQYAVQAVYAVNNPAKAVKTNIITKDMEFEVDMRVSTNSGDDVSGATVVLTHQDGNPAHVYTLTATDSVVVFPQVWKGLYNISINLANFEPYTLNNFSVQADTSLKVKLTEIILEPYGLRITGDAKDRLFAWNTYERFFDDMENQTNFEYQNIPPYTLINVDDAETNTFVTTVFPNSGYIGSYIVFNPSQTTLTSPSANPYSGYKYLACFAKKTPKIPNNDWLILPKKLIVDGVKLKFQAKTYTQQSGYSPERIRVAVSTTGTNVSDFTVISSGDYIEVPATTWTEYSFDLSAYAGQEVYLAINCVSDNGFMFMLDDISVDIESSKNAQKSFENYTVYLNGEEITTTSATQHQFTDLADGDYTAGVSTTYSSGTTSIKTIDFVVDQSSIAITQTGNFTIYPNPVTDILNIETTQTITEINVFDQNGRIVKTQKGNQKTLDLQNLPTGQYVVRIHAGGAVVPVKIIKK